MFGVEYRCCFIFGVESGNNNRGQIDKKKKERERKKWTKEIEKLTRQRKEEEQEEKDEEGGGDEREGLSIQTKVKPQSLTIKYSEYIRQKGDRHDDIG